MKYDLKEIRRVLSKTAYKQFVSDIKSRKDEYFNGQLLDKWRIHHDDFSEWCQKYMGDE